MRNIFVFFLFILYYLNTSAQNIDSTWFINNYTKLETQVSMRDGIKLFTAIYAPKDSSQKHPVLMERTPYSCEPYGKDRWIDYWSSYQKEYLREGYIMVIQDVRGRWMSEDEFVNVRPFNANKKNK